MARFYQEAADATVADLRTHCFKNGVFYSAMGPGKPLIEIDTWSHFAPLFAKLYSEAEAKSVVDTYFNNPDHFDTTYGIPTVSASDPSYAPHEPGFGKPWQHPHWRGPIWMVVNWCVYHGLKNYGFDEEAKKLKKSTAELIKKSSMREYYHPDTGLGLGADRFTWAGLYLDMNPVSDSKS
jgi:glycogen debranching enzyme